MEYQSMNEKNLNNIKYMVLLSAFLFFLNLIAFFFIFHKVKHIELKQDELVKKQYHILELQNKIEYKQDKLFFINCRIITGENCENE